jgi:hypothetical protein
VATISKDELEGWRRSRTRSQKSIGLPEALWDELSRIQEESDAKTLAEVVEFLLEYAIAKRRQEQP